MGIILNTYKKVFVKRCDKEKHIKYFTHSDFEGLERKDIEFKSAQGNVLRGGIYSYPGADEEKLIVFCHGIGTGHLNYMREIEHICKRGYTVIGYDNTGCDSSEGDNIRGLSQSLSDLHSFMKYIRTTEEYGKKKIYVIGHSWGGYAAGNILNYRDDIEKAVVISGFVSVKLLLKKIFGIFYGSILRYERKINPDYADSSSEKGYNNTKAKVLIIQSTDDPTVNMKTTVEYLKANVKGDNVEYLVVEGKRHNPNYTKDAVDYLNERFDSLTNEINAKRIVTEEDKTEYFKDVDWYRMTEQDSEVWDRIIGFIEE